jgi:hypothetical protein
LSIVRGPLQAKQHCMQKMDNGRLTTDNNRFFR